MSKVVVVAAAAVVLVAVAAGVAAAVVVVVLLIIIRRKSKSKNDSVMLAPCPPNQHTASKATTGTLLPSTNSVTLRTIYSTGSAAHTQGHFSAKIRG